MKKFYLTDDDSTKRHLDLSKSVSTSFSQMTSQVYMTTLDQRRAQLNDISILDKSKSFVEKKRYQSGVEVFCFPVNYCEYHQYNRVLRFLTRVSPLIKDDLGSPRGFGIK